MADWGESQVRLTPTVSVLVGPDNGLYPSGNSLLIEGAAENALIDPSVTVVQRGGAPKPVDAVINSHGHEDHVAGNGLLASARVHIHHDDLLAARSLDGLMAIYGFSGELAESWGATVEEEFHARGRAFIEKSAKAGKPFFLWQSSTRLHATTHLSPKWKDKT